MLIFAHRGACADAPENTLAALKEGLLQKADGIEIDVRLSRDNRMVVFHDSSLLRITGIKAKIADSSSEYLRNLDVGLYKGEKFRGEKIPFLEEILDSVPDGKLLQIDVKSDERSVPFIVDAIKNSRKNQSEIMVISSRLRVLARIRVELKDIFTAKVYGKRPLLRQNLPRIKPLLYDLKKAGATAIDFDCRFVVDKKYMDLLQKNGIKAYAWTVDNENTAIRLRELGVAGIATNQPAVIRQALEKADRVIYE